MSEPASHRCKVCGYTWTGEADDDQHSCWALRPAGDGSYILEQGTPTVTDAPLDDSIAVDVNKAGYANE